MAIADCRLDRSVLALPKPAEGVRDVMQMQEQPLRADCSSTVKFGRTLRPCIS